MIARRFNALLVRLRRRFDAPPALRSAFAITVPHKVFTYLSAGKPVLVGGEGDVASLVTGARAGIAVQPDNPEALASAVVKLHTMSQADRETMGNNGRHVACQSYNRSLLIGELFRSIEYATM